MGTPRRYWESGRAAAGRLGQGDAGRRRALMGGRALGGGLRTPVAPGRAPAPPPTPRDSGAAGRGAVRCGGGSPRCRGPAGKRPGAAAGPTAGRGAAGPGTAMRDAPGPGYVVHLAWMCLFSAVPVRGGRGARSGREGGVGPSGCPSEPLCAAARRGQGAGEDLRGVDAVPG